MDEIKDEIEKIRIRARYRLEGYAERGDGGYSSWLIWDRVAKCFVGNLDGYAPYWYARETCRDMNAAERKKVAI